MRFNIKAIISVISVLLIMNGILMLLCIPFSIHYNEDWLPILLAGMITLASGGIMKIGVIKAEDKDLKKRDGYLVVTLGWVVMSLFGTLPYIFTSSIPNFTNAVFETFSGFTTTGATILEDIEALPKGILFWRSMTQWIGGMGIIVLAVAILPILGIGGMQLFTAESSGIKYDKLKPRIQDTALRLWVIYVGLTGLQLVLMMLGDMPFYDAINHAFTTMSSGGFSTKNASIAFYDSAYIQYIIIVFMFLAGTNFPLLYFVLKGRLNKIIENEELKVYALLVLTLSIFITFIIFSETWSGFEVSFRIALFQVVSIVTTTGYVTADYTSWTPFLTTLFFILLFFGAMAGSTSGGFKLVRHILLVKNSFLEIKRQLHPSAVLPVRLNNRAISQDIIFNILAFMMIYILIFAVGSIVMSTTGLDFTSAMGATATSLANVGPAIGSVGPLNNFAHVSDFGKWVLAFLMLVGRLEIFTVMILFSYWFWAKN